MTFYAAARIRGIAFPSGFELVELIVLPFALVLIAIHLIDGYRPDTDMMSLTYTSQHIIALAVAFLGTLLITYTIIPPGFPLQVSRAGIAVAFLLFVPGSLTYRRVVSHRLARGREARRIIFVGDSSAFKEFDADCGEVGMRQQRIQFPIQSASSEAERLTAFLREYQGEIDTIVLREGCLELSSGTIQNLVSLFYRGVPTITQELFYEYRLRRTPYYRLNQIWLFQSGFPVARQPGYDRLKRASDIIFAFSGLILFSPFIALAACAVWIEDRGPVFFRQDRVGKNRKIFRILKLRTMKLDSANADPYTRKQDNRVTMVGKFLRHTRLDEAPQLWNVLKGEMSLIGPRAEWVRLVEDYEKEISNYYFRHLVKPGITGWAQVNYPYGSTTKDTIRKLEFDLFYIRHYSFVLDASIILKTIHVMLFGKGR